MESDYLRFNLNAGKLKWIVDHERDADLRTKLLALRDGKLDNVVHNCTWFLFPRVVWFTYER